MIIIIEQKIKKIIHLFIGNDNIDEIKKINEEIFSYIIKQIETNFIQKINLNEKFCFEKILKSTLNSFSKNYLLIKHIHTKGNDYSVNSLNDIGKKEKNNISLDIIKVYRQEDKMQESLDTISLSELISVYNEISSMVKSLEEKENALLESEQNA